MNSLVVPGTGVSIKDGSIVMLARFPGKKWIAHQGWYKYNDQQRVGWYFCSIPENSVIPINDVDLSTIIIVSGGGSTHCHPHPPHFPSPYPPCPDPEDHNPISEQAKWELDRAFITVNTIAERDALNSRLLPDGKLVRVNNDGDSAAYFRWNQVSQTWEEEFFNELIEGQFLTEEQAVDMFASHSEVSEVKSSADTAVECAQSALSSAVDAQTQVHSIQQNIEQVVSEKVEKFVSDEKVTEVLEDVLAEKLPSAIEDELSEQLKDAAWGSLA